MPNRIGIASAIYAHIRTENVPAGQGPFTLEVRLKSDSQGKAQVFWTTAKEPRFAKERSVFFDVRHDGQWHENAVQLPCPAGIKSLRLDPSTAPGEIRLASLRLKNQAGKSVMEWRFDQKAPATLNTRPR